MRRDTFDEGRGNRANGRKLPPPPDYCSADGCNNEAALVIVSVWHGQTLLHGAGSDFTDSNGNLRPGLEYARYITRCAECRRGETPDKRLAAEGKRLDLTLGRDGETLPEYLERHGIDRSRLTVYKPIGDAKK